MQMEDILETILMKRTRYEEYYEYLVKWIDRPVDDVTWVTTTSIHKSGKIIKNLMGTSP